VEEVFFSVIESSYVSDVRKIAIHTAELGPSHLETEIAIAKLKKYKPQGIDQILSDLYQAGGETLVSAIHKLTVIIIVGYHCYQLHKNCYQISFFHG
jgi:hypothetical protein